MPRVIGPNTAYGANGGAEGKKVEDDVARPSCSALFCLDMQDRNGRLGRNATHFADSIGIEHEIANHRYFDVIKMA